MANDKIDFSKQAKSIRNINQSLEITQRLLTNQLKLQEVINASLKGGIENMPNVGVQIETLLRDKAKIDTSVVGAMSRVGTSATITSSDIDAAAARAQGSFGTMGEVIGSGFRDSRDHATAMVGHVVGAVDSSHKLLDGLAMERKDMLLAYQQELGEGVIFGAERVGGHVNRVSQAGLAAMKAYYAETIPGMGLAFKQVFQDATEVVQYIDSITRAAKGGARYARSMNDEQLKRAAVLGKSLGYSAEETRFFVGRQMEITGKAGTKLLEEAALFSHKIAAHTGVSSKRITGHISDMIQDTQYFGNTSVKEMAKIGGALEELGMEYENMSGMVQKFSGFEDAATSVGQLTQLFGINLDAAQLMYGANEDQFGMLQQLRSAFIQAGKSADMMSMAEKRSAVSIMGLKDVAEFERLIDPSTDIASLESMSDAVDKIGTADQQDALSLLTDDIQRTAIAGGNLSEVVADQLVSALGVDLADAAAKAGTGLDQMGLAATAKAAQSLKGAVQGLTGASKGDLDAMIGRLEKLTGSFAKMGDSVGGSDVNKKIEAMAGSFNKLGGSLAAGFSDAFTKSTVLWDSMIKKMVAAWKASNMGNSSMNQLQRAHVHGAMEMHDSELGMADDSLDKMEGMYRMSNRGIQHMHASRVVQEGQEEIKEQTKKLSRLEQLRAETIRHNTVARAAMANLMQQPLINKDRITEQGVFIKSAFGKAALAASKELGVKLDPSKAGYLDELKNKIESLPEGAQVKYAKMMKTWEKESKRGSIEISKHVAKGNIQTTAGYQAAGQQLAQVLAAGEKKVGSSYTFASSITQDMQKKQVKSAGDLVSRLGDTRSPLSMMIDSMKKANIKLKDMDDKTRASTAAMLGLRDASDLEFAWTKGGAAKKMQEQKNQLLGMAKNAKSAGLTFDQMGDRMQKKFLMLGKFESMDLARKAFGDPSRITDQFERHSVKAMEVAKKTEQALNEAKKAEKAEGKKGVQVSSVRKVTVDVTRDLKATVSALKAATTALNKNVRDQKLKASATIQLVLNNRAIAEIKRELAFAPDPKDEKAGGNNNN